MGKIDKGVKCSVAGCGNQAVRSLDSERASKAGLHVEGSRRAYLCKDHYKEMKKRTRKDRLLERWRMTR
ncbi:MAG: hypothetical protein QXI59_07130 [Candidatus Bathyarchaeia archaeon]|nr:hypothetical protein [Candidatus Bathyarchaeota archaeon]